MAQILDTTPEYILGWNSLDDAYLTTSDMHKKLVEYIYSLPSNKAQLALQIIKLISESE